MVIHRTGNRHAHTHLGVCLVRILGKSEERSKNKSCLHLVIISSLMIITMGSTPLLTYIFFSLVCRLDMFLLSYLFLQRHTFGYTVWPSTSQVSIPLMWCPNSVSVPVSYVCIYHIIYLMTNIVLPVCLFACLTAQPDTH